MKTLSNVDWIWNSGKVFSTLQFTDGTSESRSNENPPPTLACHDIAHFICGFHENLEWDYQKEPNHIAEYNAVFVEHLLTHFCYYYYNEYPIDFYGTSLQIFNYMKWFSEDYYVIKFRHPSRKNYLELQKDFFKKIDVNVLTQHFTSFYNTWIIQDMIQSPNFNINIKMTGKEENGVEEISPYFFQIEKYINSFS